LSAQLLRIPGAQHAARDLDFAERIHLQIQHHVERRVDARGLAQHLQVRDDGLKAFSAVIAWKSTAILVVMTSVPSTGRAPRFGQV
jgi:hypothetical protein